MINFILAVVILIGPAFAGTSEDSLKDSYNRFVKAKETKNFKTWATFIEPVMVQQWGGLEKVAEQLKKLHERMYAKKGVPKSDAKVEIFQDIQICKNYFCTMVVISTGVERPKHGKGRIFSKVLALGEKHTQKWYFVEMNEAGKKSLIKKDPILDKVISYIEPVGKFPDKKEFKYIEFPSEIELTEKEFQDQFFPKAEKILISH
ncbi:MAG TPA: hypothetical protein VNJ08_04350 [Bacteriovoracaceae bacterium]|nr:hypothetical protein [Bacteriovoracaceae bacterium]